MSVRLDPLPLHTVSLLEGGRLIATTATNASGQYAFTGLEQAVYDVQVVAPSHGTAVVRQPVARRTTPTLAISNFLVVPSKPEGIFGAHAGVAFESSETTLGLDVDRSGLIDFADLQVLYENLGADPETSDGDLNGDGAIDGADVAEVEAWFGRVALDLPRTFAVDVGQGDMLLNIAAGETVAGSVTGHTEFLMTATPDPAVVNIEIVDSAGLFDSDELGRFGFADVSGSPVQLPFDLATGRLAAPGGVFSIRLVGGAFSPKVDLAGITADAFVALAPGGFELHHVVDTTATIPVDSPVFPGDHVQFSSCKPKKPDNFCKSETVLTHSDCPERGGTRCKSNGASCASAGHCGTCTTVVLNVRGVRECQRCECK